MTTVVMGIKYWGNSLGVRLPAKLAKEARLHADQQVRMHVEDGRVIIEPVLGEQPSLAERLSKFDPERHGGECMNTTDEQGAEKW